MSVPLSAAGVLAEHVIFGLLHVLSGEPSGLAESVPGF